MNIQSSKKIFAFILGAGCIIYICYNRLFWDRWPIDLLMPLTQTRFVIYVFIIIVNLILLIVIVYSYYKNNDRDTWSKRISAKLQDKINFIFQSLGQTYLNSVNYIPTYYSFFLHCINRYAEISLTLRRYCIVFLLAAPRSIVVSCFLYDVFIENKFFYFYKVLWLLLIPLLVSFVFFILKDVYYNAHATLFKYITIEPYESSVWKIKSPHALSMIPTSACVLINKKDSPFSQEYIEWLYELLFAFQNGLWKTISLRNKLNFYFGIVLRIFYIIGWSYIIFLGTDGFSSFPFDPFSFKLNLITLIPRSYLLLLTTRI